MFIELKILVIPEPPGLKCSASTKRHHRGRGNVSMGGY